MKKTTIWPGEDQAWKLLAGLDPNKVETNAGVTYDHTLSAYVLNCFGQVISVSLRNQNISGSSEIGDLLVEKLSEFSRFSILSYLIHAKNVPFSGQLVRPSNLTDGEIFLRGTHVLPLNKIAKCYSNNTEEFLNKGRILGGIQLKYGDVSLELSPFPRIQIVLIVWLGDEEFPSNASLLIDSSCTSHLQTDVIWAMAKMTVELMLL